MSSIEQLVQKFCGVSIPFEKYTAAGNNFVLIDERENEFISEGDKGDFAALYCGSDFGIGANEVIFLQPSQKANVRMRLIEPDRSESEMCGNGVRCIAEWWRRRTGNDSCSIEVKAGAKEWNPSIKSFDGGVREVQKVHNGQTPKGSYFCVDMGSLKTDLFQMPSIQAGKIESAYALGGRKIPQEFLDENYMIDTALLPAWAQHFANIPLRISIVHTGEPHAVIFVNEVSHGTYAARFSDRQVTAGRHGLHTDDIIAVTEAIKKDSRFFKQDPACADKQCNINLVQVLPDNSMRILTNERGTGITLACGTGSTACAAVAMALGKLAYPVAVYNTGGVVYIERSVNHAEHLTLTGPAQFVYKGIIQE